jgi:hypothetical protein
LQELYVAVEKPLLALEKPSLPVEKPPANSAIYRFRSSGKLFEAKTLKSIYPKPELCRQGAVENSSGCEMHFSWVESAKQLPCALPAIAKYTHANVFAP